MTDEVTEGEETTMQAGRRRLYWTFAVTLIGMSLVAALLFLSHPHSLLGHATKIADVHTWQCQSDAVEFYWLSDYQLLYQSASTTSKSGSTIHSGTYFLWNLRTNHHTPLPLLTKHVFTVRQRQDERLYPSPDGQWIYMLAGHHLLMLCRLDGTHFREWNDANGADWLPDSRHLELLENGVALSNIALMNFLRLISPLQHAI